MSIFKVKYILFFGLFAFCFQTLSYADADSDKIIVKGSVFIDANGNSKKDIDEIGMGGVVLTSNRGHRIICDQDGHFEAKLEKTSAFYEINIVRDSLPAGFQHTNPPARFISPREQNFQTYNFGVTYPVKTKKLKIKKMSEKIKEEKIQIGKVLISIKDYKLFLNDDLLVKIPNTEGELQHKKINLKLNEINFDFDEEKLSLFIAELEKTLSDKIINNVKINIALPSKLVSNHKPFEYIKNKLSKTIFEKLDLKKDQLNFDYQFDQAGINLNFSYGSPALEVCRISEGNLSYVINKYKSIELTLKDKKDYLFKLNCSQVDKSFLVRVKHGKYIADIDKRRIVRNLGEIERLETQQIASSGNEPILYLKTSKYIDHNRDLLTHFSFQGENIKEVHINGKKFDNVEVEKGYTHKSKVGNNVLKISLIDKDGRQAFSKHRFNLFRQKKFYFSTFIDNYNLKSQSSRFDFSYSIPATNRTNNTLQYFVDAKWGVNFNYVADLNPTDVELAGGGETVGARSELAGHIVYRYRFDDQDFYSAVLQLYGGFQQKTTDLPESAVINFPEDYTGLSLGAEILKEHFFIEDMDTSSQAFFSTDGESTLLRFSQEFRLNMNRVGRWLGTSYDQIYEKKYHHFSNMRFIVGVNLERDIRQAENADAVVTDEIVVYRAGISYQY
jgi:hypothetical protein